MSGADYSTEDSLFKEREILRLPTEFISKLRMKIAPTRSPDWVKGLYGTGHNRTIKKVKAAVKKDGGRVEGIPESPKEKGVLVTALVKVIGVIVQKARRQNLPGESRKVVNSQEEKFQYRNSVGNNPSPSIAIEAAGSSFEEPREEDAIVGFGNVATLFNVKLDAETDDDEPYLKGYSETDDMGLYAIQMFMAQPNRRFVRTMLITENRFRLMQFDREGAIFSPLINYHDDFDTFTRAILSLSSTDEEDLGLDTSVKWKVVQGRKISGTIEAYNDRSETTKTYTMTSVYPSFVRPEVYGWGTVCWDVKDPLTGEVFVIKDAWIQDSANTGMKEEYHYLEQARGVAGIIQMVSYEDREGLPSGDIKSFRPSFETESGNLMCPNRIFRRLVLKKYGKDIDQFQSQLQLFSALHDVIDAHGKLYMYRNILHRDISSTNILLGLPGASLGSRGVLIDLDHAIEVQLQDSANAESGGAVGTRIFQPYFVLKGSGLYEYRPTHDYLDDLEAIFLILYLIMHEYTAVGKTKPVSFLKAWSHSDPEVGAAAKRELYNGPLDMTAVPEFWSEPCKSALVEFHKFVSGIIVAKEEIVGDMKKSWDVEPMFELHRMVYDHYTRVLDVFKKATEALTSETTPARIPLAPTTRTNKRTMGNGEMGGDDEGRKHKRACLSASGPDSGEA
ncbi:hypothetical protein D9611_006044 [Ephemerocybe angulata]|uniref:Fungal-type protein kinase domain-containing protein n=1 Tax=Ephemerocybe angulata TaxID=980116 RepID=A0A8H5CID1_9AGAR|nr:hypothetical protein D9611_006044 [Tulosesus angulatus]